MGRIAKLLGVGAVVLTIGLSVPSLSSAQGEDEIYNYHPDTGEFACEDTCGGATLCCENGEPVWHQQE